MTAAKIFFGLLLIALSAVVTSARFIDGDSMLIKRLMLNMYDKNGEIGAGKINCEITRHGDCYYSASFKPVDIDVDPDARRYREGLVRKFNRFQFREGR